MSQLALRVGRHNGQAALYRVTVVRDGVDLHSAGGGFTTLAKIKVACRDDFRNLVTPDEVSAAIAAFRDAGSPKGETILHVITRPDAPPPITFERRALGQPRESASRHESLVAALMHSGTEDDIVSWDRRSAAEACVVDLDWHGEHKYATRDDLRPLYDRINEVRPRPGAGWVTRNCGVRLVYTGSHSDLRAAIAAVDLVRRLWDHESRPSGVELKTDTRVMPSWSRLVAFDQDTDFATRKPSLDVDFEPDAWVEYLVSRDMVIGQRYSHDKCLVAPWRGSKSGKPVEVRDNCVVCHSCAGYGQKGAVLYASRLLADDSTPHGNDDMLATMVRNFTHYEHAEFVLRQRVPPIVRDSLLKLYYRALLVKYHGDTDPRVDMVFAQYGVIRLNGVWGDLCGSPRKAALMKHTAAALPATHGPDGVSMIRVEKFLDSGDLTSCGYPTVRPVFGMRIGTHHQPATDGVPRVVVATAAKRPTYIDESRRKATGRSREWAWETLEQVWPGITREYIEMLIISRGLVERGDISITPMFWLNEAKAAGKTASINIAAGICGDHCTVIPPTAVSEDNHKEILYALDKGSFALFDEPGKEAMTLRKPMSFFRFLLQLSPQLQAKRLYLGPVSLGWLPVIALADTKWPDGFEQDGQLGRRLFRVNLNPVTQRWDQSAAKVGIFNFADPRRVMAGCEEVAEACDVLLSCIIDEYFGGEILPLADIAAKLGIRYMTDGVHHRDHVNTLRDFYAAWERYTATVKSFPGYKAFSIEEASDLANLWDKLREPGDRFAFRGGENDEPWAQIIGHPSRRLEMLPVRRLAQHPTHVAVGFQHGADRDSMAFVYGGA